MNTRQKIATSILVVSSFVGGLFLSFSETYSYISPNGVDTNNCTRESPCKTVLKASEKDNQIVFLEGSYGSMNVSLIGSPDLPYSLIGENAVFTGTLTISNSQWVEVEGISFTSTGNQVSLNKSHFLKFRNNYFDYRTRGISIQGYSSNILVEGNEFTQSCSLGKNWSQLKGSTCEGGGVYGSSYGGGSYYIRNNYVHDVFNGFYFTDDTAGKWMNSNIFIYNNIFERVIDDPAEPEGDSFNFYFYNNYMKDTHRMISLTSGGLGKIFVYNNVQITEGNPTYETGRLNSAFKIDLSSGFSNGVYIFNNTIIGNNGYNFYGYDMLSRSVNSPLYVRNNVYLLNLKVFSSSPTGGDINFDFSQTAFGMNQPNGYVGNLLIDKEGKPLSGSPILSKSEEIYIEGNFFDKNVVIEKGSDAGAFQENIPNPKWVSPPNLPSQIPINTFGFPDNSIYITPTFSSTNTPTKTPTSSVTPTVTKPITFTPTLTITPSSQVTPTETPICILVWKDRVEFCK